MSKKKTVRRDTHVNLSRPVDAKKQSTRMMIFMLALMLFYPSWCLSGLFRLKLTLDNYQDSILYCFKHPVFDYNEKTPLCLLIGAMIWMVASLMLWSEAQRNLMHGQEYGTAEWGSIREFNRKFGNPASQHEEFDESTMKLSENLRFRYNDDTLRNHNMFVAGGSGSGKTAMGVVPNLLTNHDCNVYTDPKGTLVEEYGTWLASQPNTTVYVLDMCDWSKSMHFNPLSFIRKRSDIPRLIANIQANTENAQTKAAGVDPFWSKAEAMFLNSVLTYIWMECPTTVYQEGRPILLEKNWRSVMKLLDWANFGDNGEKPFLDHLMFELGRVKGQMHPARRMYERYRFAAEDTVRSVLATAFSRLQVFDDEELLELFDYNEIPLDEFGVGHNGDGVTKSNLFIVIPDEDSTYDFVPGMVYTLLFQELYRQGRICGGRLPLDVGFWLDEFANIKMPHDYKRILATCRSRGIYCVMFLQSLSQMKELFTNDGWEGIIGNCDVFLYLGGNEPSTFEYLEKLLGKFTADKATQGETKGTTGSTSTNYDVVGVSLMDAYQIRLLPEDECIIFMRSFKPLRDKKWFPWEHELPAQAKAMGNFDGQKEIENIRQKNQSSFLSEKSVDYLKRQAKGVRAGVEVHSMSMLDFLTLDIDHVMNSMNHTTEGSAEEPECINLAKLAEYAKKDEARIRQEKRDWYLLQYADLPLMDIYGSEQTSNHRKEVIRQLIRIKAPEEEIKEIVHPELTEAEVTRKKEIWMEMHGIAS